MNGRQRGEGGGGTWNEGKREGDAKYLIEGANVLEEEERRGTEKKITYLIVIF